jgi:hypothetical protein
MIDVVIRTRSAVDGLRAAMLEVSLERWALETKRILFVRDLGIKEGRLWAEENTLSDPYIFTDDDCLIVGKGWLERAAALLLANPRFVMVSTLSLIEGENLARPATDDDIYPMHAVGQPMLVRRGFCAQLPDMDLNNECGTLHKMIIDKGYEMGLIHPKHHLRHNHLGHAFSSNPALHWGV